MALVRKEVMIEVKIGDTVECPNSILKDDSWRYGRSSSNLYVCHIEDDLLFLSKNINSYKDECEVVLAEDCYLV